jgi:hypothetical protein
VTTVSALAEVDIANMALSYLGISNQIQAFTDQNEQAKACGFWYPKCRDELLRMAPWSFAYTSAQLASDASTSGVAGSIGAQYAFPGWKYGYVYPNDCLQAIAITTYAGQRSGNSYWTNYWQGSIGIAPQVQKIPYKIVQSTANPGQLMLVCDILASATTPLYLFYIQCVTNTAQFDVLFSDALSWSIAHKVGMTLRSANPNKVQYAQAMAKQARLEALAQVLNEFQQDNERDSPSVQARW